MDARLSRTMLALALSLSLLPLAACGSSTEATTDTPAAEQESTGSDEKTDESATTSDDSSSSDAEKDDAAATTDSQDAADASVQRVGAEGIGFVTIPSTWAEFHDVDGNTSVQWCDGTPYTIISLNTFDTSGMSEEDRASFTAADAANSVWAKILGDGVEDDAIEGAYTKLAGRDAVQIYARYPDGSYLVCWTVQDDEGVIRYIAAEGTDDTIMEAVGYVENTYEL